MALRSASSKEIDVGVHAVNTKGRVDVLVNGVIDGDKQNKVEIAKFTLTLPQPCNYVSDPLACEKALLELIDRGEVFDAERKKWESKDEWAGAVEQSPRFLKSQARAARRVAASRVAAVRGGADIGLSFVDNARLVLVGSQEQLQNICVAARRAAVDADGVFVENGLLTRESAANILEGDVFHFVAAVPISTLAAFVNAVTSQRGISGAAVRMRESIKESGVELDTQLHIRLHWGAFPGGQPQVQRLRDDGVVALNALTTYKGFYVIIGGFYDPPKGDWAACYEIHLPGGKRNLGESGLDCCLRETSEETLLRLHTNYDHEYPEGPGTDVRGVKINYDYGPYHIVASVPDAYGRYPRFCESGGGSKGGRGGGRKGGRGGRSKGGSGGGRKGGRGKGAR